jgi:dTDP-4-amino-4,6-dideoxygalactose transaminase
MPDSHVLLSPPDVGEVEEALVLEAMRSGWVAPAGPFLARFESELAERTGRAHAVALSSGTAALHLSLLAVDVREGDVVLMPTLTFVATANAVIYTGAEPCFVDVDPGSGNLDVDAMCAATENLRASGRRVTTVIPVDIFGVCADYSLLLSAAQDLDLVVIEDAAEALGSTHPLGRAGSFGVAAALSFNGNKIMTTSGGGAVVTDDLSLANQVRYLSTQAREPVPHYEHRAIGYNYRLSNILAAIGVGQLSRLDDMIDRRRAIHASYVDLFDGVSGVRLLDGTDGFRSNCWLSVLVVDEERSSWHVDSLAKHMAAHDIETRPVWKPMHLQPVYAGRPTQLTGVAENLFERGLVLPGGSAHSSGTVSRIMGCVADFLGAQR